MNKRNLQKELESIIAREQNSNTVPGLLLHICCAPCSSYCLEYLSRYFSIGVYFYNPNIDEEKEYRKRVQEAKRLIGEMHFENEVCFIEGKYEPKLFRDKVRGHEKDEEGGARCSICYEMRLLQSAYAALERGYDYFATSLSISPMKDAEKLCEIGERIGKEIGVSYLPSDFKKKNGYKRSVELSKEHELYRQDYCGCSFSKAALSERRKERGL